MKDIKINILDVTDNEHYWNYEIVIDGKRFISGWYKYPIWQFYYDKNMDQYIKRVYCKYDNTLSKKEVQKIKKECVLILKDKPFYVKGVTQEIVDFIANKIKELYKDILNNFRGYSL
jgi:hypothetical protein